MKCLGSRSEGMKRTVLVAAVGALVMQPSCATLMHGGDQSIGITSSQHLLLRPRDNADLVSPSRRSVSKRFAATPSGGTSPGNAPQAHRPRA